MDTIKLTSLNCRGLKNRLKRLSVFHYLKNKKFDIVCLQETHISTKDLPVWEKQWGGEIFYNQGSNYGGGEVILIAKHFTGKATQIRAQKRILMVSIAHEKYNFTLANIYAPNNRTEKVLF